MINPTVGRVVHVHNRLGAQSKDPEAATVAYVHSPGMINVGGFDANGNHFSATSVPFIHEGDPKERPGFAWAEFPPRF